MGLGSRVYGLGLVQEIINAAKSISTPIITCTLRDEFNEARRGLRGVDRVVGLGFRGFLRLGFRGLGFIGFRSLGFRV